jgi:uncharacterized protein YhfF
VEATQHDLARWREASGLDLQGAFAFGDSPTMADELLDVVRAGTKRATAGSLAEQEAGGGPLPAPGQRWGLLEGAGELCFVMETVDVEHGRLAEVTPAFAWDEGEDDRTRESWLDAHRRFLARRGVTDPDEHVVTFERFRIVWPEPDPRDVWVTPDVRELRWDERGWYLAFYQDRWGATQMATRGVVHEVGDLPGLVCEREGERVGVTTFRPRPGGDTEVVTFDALQRGAGVGASLTAGLRALARRSGWRRVWLVTTNDNTPALRAYQRLGWELTALHHGAVDEARARLKPSIPTHGLDGIALRSELVLELDLSR